MNRREFLRASTTSLSLMGMATSPLLAAHQSQSNIDFGVGWRSVRQNQFAPLNMTVSGKIPQDLNGTLFRNGPAKSQRQDVIAEHWFDGDGMIQRFSFQDGRVVHDGKIVETERFVEEEQAQAFLYSQSGSHLASGKSARNNDTINQANIAVVPWDGELLALWEGGSAYRLDQHSLATLGRKDWRDDLMHLPFSAHPLFDKNNTMWNFGLAPYAGKNGLLMVFEIHPNSGVKRAQAVKLPFAGYVHDFAQTEQHLVFFIPPHHSRHEHGNTFVTRFKWQPELGSRLLVVDKNDLTKQRWFELPPGFVFHLGNAWSKGNQVGVNMCLYEDASLMQSTRQQRIDQQHRPLNKQSKVSTVIADLATGNIQQITSDVVMEFPEFNQNAYRADTELLGVGVVEQLGKRSDALTVYAPWTGKTQHYLYPEQVIAEEPLEVTTPNKNTYVLQTILDMQAEQTQLHVFDRQDITTGPIATATMDRLLPLGLHGCFIRA